MSKTSASFQSGTSDYRLNVAKTVEGSAMQFEVFTDADWAREGENRKSVNAALTFMNGMIISWRCNKQPLVALSTMEIEFVAAARGVQEAMGCYHTIKELEQPMQMPLQLKMDNQAAFTSIMNEAGSSKTKHIDIKNKIIKDLYRAKLLTPTYVPTLDMKADILAKIMPGPNFVRLRSLIGINTPGNHEGKIRCGVFDGTI
jgi:hypothetical protein